MCNKMAKNQIFSKTTNTVAPFYPKFAISQTMKCQGRLMLQYNAK